MLNFTSLSYQPSGDCIDHTDQLKIKAWGILPTTLCCQPPLTLISKSLARLSSNSSHSETSIFLDRNQWSSCDNLSIFQPQQDSINFDDCNFKNFFKEASVCSRLSMADLKKDQKFNDASAICRNFARSSSSFDEICRDCSSAVLKARASVTKVLQVNGNETENEACGVVVVTALASEIWNESSFAAVDDLYECLQHKYAHAHACQCQLHAQDEDGLIRSDILQTRLWKTYHCVYVLYVAAPYIIIMIKTPDCKIRHAHSRKKPNETYSQSSREIDWPIPLSASHGILERSQSNCG